MKKLFLFLLFITIYSCSSSRYSKVDSKVCLKYNEKTPLEWKDFKGAKKDVNINDSAYFATSIHLSTGRNIWWGYKYYDAHGVMIPKESWAKSSYQTDYNLQKFQTEFRIYEIFARRLMKYIKTNNIDTDNKIVVDSVFKMIGNQLDKYKDAYLKETKNGKDTTIQRIWNEKIKIELNNTEIINGGSGGALF